jgi:hypothetical protein
MNPSKRRKNRDRCTGVIAFAPTLEECKPEFGHQLPVVGDFDTNEISMRMEPINKQMTVV